MFNEIDDTRALEAERRYLALFNSIDQGFCTIDVAFDADDRAVDYRFVEVSPSFPRQTGIEHGAGRSMREIAPDQDEHWFEIYGRVSLTGEPASFEERSTPLERWWSVYAFRIEDHPRGRVGVLFNDITERKRAEAALQESEARQAFLLKLSDALRPLADPEQVQAIAADLLGEQLHVNHCHYGEVRGEYVRITHSYADGLPPMTGNFLAGDFGKRLIDGYRAGILQVCTDTATDPLFSAEERQVLERAEIGAYVAMPLVKDGEWVATLAVQNTAPRAWRSSEIALVQEVAERTWAAVVRAGAEQALRERDAEIDAIINRTPFMLTRCTRELRYRYVSRAYAEMIDRTPDDINGKRIVDVMGEEGWNTIAPRVERVLRGEQVEYMDEVSFRNAGDPYLHVVYTPDTDAAGNVNGWFESIADISGRRAAEIAMRQSEEQFRTLFETMEEGCAVCEGIRDESGKMIDYRLLLLNPAYEQLTGGLKLQDAVGKRVLELFPGFDPWWLETFQRVLDTRETIRFEHYFPHTGRWYGVTAFPYPGERFAYLYREVTDRKRHENALAFLADVSQDLVRLTNIDETLNALGAKIGAHLNASVCVFTDVHQAEGVIVAGHEWHRAGVASLKGVYRFDDFHTPEFRNASCAGETYVVRNAAIGPRVDGANMAAIGVGAYVNVPLVRNGKWLFNLTICDTMPREWRDDEIELARELTVRIWARLARARAEEAMRVSEERLRVLIESVTDYAIFTLDPAGHVTSWNDGAHRLKGYNADEIVGRPVSSFYLPEDVASGKPKREMQQAVRTGRSEDESWRVRKDGSRFWGNEIMTPLRSPDGRHLGFTTITRDLTERKAFEDALRHAHDELEQRVQRRTADLADANASLQAEVRERRAAEAQIKGLFERLISVQEEERRRIARDIHDHLGQQMTALRMHLEVIRMWADGDPARVDQAKRARQVAEELDRSIDFLTWELRPAALDHLGLPAALQRLVSGWSERFGIVAEFDTAGTDGLRLSRDAEGNLYRIVQEALHNVVKHAVATHVTVLLEHRNDQVVLLIEDNGRGFMLAEAQLRPDGNRLGLIGMRERALLVGGTIEMDTSPGRGTTIFVRVPLHQRTEESGRAG